MLTYVYLCLLVFTYVYHCLFEHCDVCLTMFARVYLCLHIHTFTSFVVFTYVYTCLPMFTSVYSSLPTFTLVYVLTMFTRFTYVTLYWKTSLITALLILRYVCVKSPQVSLANNDLFALAWFYGQFDTIIGPRNHSFAKVEPFLAVSCLYTAIKWRSSHEKYTELHWVTIAI